MKRIYVLGLVSLLSLGMIGCGDELTDRERECIKLTGNMQCKSETELQIEAQKAQAQADIRQAEIAAEAVDDQADMALAAQQSVDYGPVTPGNHVNYYGNPQYGQWMPNGQFQFFDPYGHAAQSTNSFLLGAGLGGLAGYMATKAAMRSDWNRSNPKGWNSRSWKSDTYMYKGKAISKDEALRRMKQSNQDLARNQAKMKQQLMAKNSTKKYTQSQPKKPNYMTQPRAPRDMFSASTQTKPRPKMLSLKKTPVRTAVKVAFAKKVAKYKSGKKRK